MTVAIGTLQIRAAHLLSSCALYFERYETVIACDLVALTPVEGRGRDSTHQAAMLKNRIGVALICAGYLFLTIQI